MKNESTLPKWAQDRFADLRLEIESQRCELERLKRAHAVLTGREGWFTIHGPRSNCVIDDTYYLFYLSREGAHPACSLQVGDILLIGRKET